MSIMLPSSFFGGERALRHLINGRKRFSKRGEMRRATGVDLLYIMKCDSYCAHDLELCDEGISFVMDSLEQRQHHE